MTALPPSLPSSFVDPLTASVEARRRGMQQLVELARRDPATGSSSLPVFQRTVRNETDPWTASQAARGIGVLLGHQAGLEARRVLLRRREAEVVAQAVLDVDDRVLVPELLDVLQRPCDSRVRTAVINRLGRLRDPRALPMLLECLREADGRPHAVEALSAFGDPCAIPYLEAFAGDQRAVSQDARGEPTTVGQLVDAAVRHLRRREAGMAAHRPAGTTIAGGRTPSPDARHSEKPSTPRQPFPWLVWFPLLAAGAQLPWMFVVLITQFNQPGTGNRAAAVAHNRMIAAVLLIPVVIGLLGGMGLLAATARDDKRARLKLLLGCLACGFFVYWIGPDLFKN